RGRAARRCRGTRRAASCAPSPAHGRPGGRADPSGRRAPSTFAGWWAALRAVPVEPFAGGYGLSLAVEPAESVISHCPLIFWRVWVTPASATTIDVLGSM